MIKVTHTILSKFWLASLFACLIALPLSFVGTSSAFAASNALPVNNCLREYAAIQHDGNDEILLTGATTSYCGRSGIVTNVNQQINVTNGCEGTVGTGPSNLPDNFQIPFGSSESAQYTDQVGCVNCLYTNHILTGRTYPNFTMFVTVSASGSYRQSGRTIYVNDDGPASASLLITNTGRNAPACPPTH